VPRPTHRILPATVVPAAIRQIAAIAVVGAVGTTALAASHGLGVQGVSQAAATTGATGAARQDAGRAIVGVPGAKATTKQSPSAATVKPSTPAPAGHAAGTSSHPVAAKAPAHWIPSGTGMWLYEWNKSNGGNASAVVARARSVGLTHLFVRTGSSHDGYTGGAALNALLPATAHTNLRVIAWDFPELKHPKGDAWRLAYAAWTGHHGAGPHVAAVAPDIETTAEGTHTSAARVTVYLAELRRLLPADVSILTTVPWPSSSRVGRYPYQAVAARSDALLPMAYWYDNSPAQVTATSISFLRRYGRPVQPVGQGYDGKLDVPWLRHNNLRKQMPKFFITARRMGASAVSVWSWQAAPPVAWGYLSYAANHRWFPAHR
jgi:hypothetical protein